LIYSALLGREIPAARRAIWDVLRSIPMAAAPQNFPNKGLDYSNLVKPVSIDCNFIVDSANGNGLGIRSLKSNGYVKNVFMHTSAPLAGSGNPNPAVGYAVVQLAGNFNHYIGGFSGVIAPLSSTSLTSVVSGNPYVITSLGTTTLAQWQAAGLPKGFTPTVGQAFIAIESSAIGGTATVGAPGIATSSIISIVGDPNQTIANSNVSANGGAQIIVQFLAATSSSVTTLVAAAPADSSVIALDIRLDASSVTVDGL
jgi:hypothetical protein